MQSCLIRDVDAIEGLRSEWAELWQRCAGATSFQRPEWILTWIQSFRPVEPMIVMVRQDGRLVGLAPLLIYVNQGERVLALLGGGVSDYLDVLVEPGNSGEIIAAIWDEIMRISASWDRVDFTDLSRNSPLLPMSNAMRGVEVEQHDACPVIRINHPGHDIRRVVAAKQLTNLRNARSRLKRAGSGHIELATSENIGSFLDELIHIHGRRWRRGGMPGVLADVAVQKFHRRVAGQLFKAGMVRLYRLLLENRTIAVLYALFEPTAVRFYLQGYDPEFSWLSPGTQVVGAMIEDAVRAGKKEIDLLRGREAYKYAWGARDVPTFRLQLRKDMRPDVLVGAPVAA